MLNFVDINTILFNFLENFVFIKRFIFKVIDLIKEASVV